MKKLVKGYIDQILIVVAALFVGLVIWFLIDSTAVISANFTKAIAPPSLGENALRFQLDQARALNYRGLGQ